MRSVPCANFGAVSMKDLLPDTVGSAVADDLLPGTVTSIMSVSPWLALPASSSFLRLPRVGDIGAEVAVITAELDLICLERRVRASRHAALTVLRSSCLCGQ